MKKLVVFLMLFWVTNVSASTAKEVTLEKCVDGDTAYFLVDGESTKFRFLALDTPESVHPTKGEEAYGKSASEFTCELLQNAEKIVVEYDDGSGKTDKYDRNLAWIWVDNELLQKIIVEQGYGQVAYIYGDYKYTKNLCAIQKEAISQKINVWSNEEYEEGYCKKVDVTGVSTKITMDMEVEKEKVDYLPYIIVGGCLVVSLITGKKINTKKLKKMLK